MPKATPETTRHAATVRALAALAAAPHLDARLLSACEAFECLQEMQNKLYRETPRGYLKSVAAAMPMKHSLIEKIISTPARTPAGRLAKAEAGLSMLGGKRQPNAKASAVCIAQAALLDFIAAESSREPA